MRTIQMTLDDELVATVDKNCQKIKDNSLCFCTQGIEGCHKTSERQYARKTA